TGTPNGWVSILLQTRRVPASIYIPLNKILPLPVRELDREALIRWLCIIRLPTEPSISLRLNKFDMATNNEDSFCVMSLNPTVQVSIQRAKDSSTHFQQPRAPRKRGTKRH